MKWLLEQDLRGVRAKRGALKKATTIPAPAKRKVDAIAEKGAVDDNQQNTAKRQKPDKKASLESSRIQERDFAGAVSSKPLKAATTEQPPKSTTTPAKDLQANVAEKQTDSGDKEPKTTQLSAAAPVSAGGSAQPLEIQPSEPTKSNAADGAPSEAPMSADANDMSLESIFGSPTAGENGANEFDLNIDMTGDLAAHGTQVESSEENINTAEDPASLNALLPGLESYANATNDNFTMLNTTQDSNNLAGVGLTNQSSTDSNAFELPSLDDTNDFDAFLNSNDFQAPTSSEQKKDDPLNDDSMLNLGELEDDWFT